MCNLRVITDPTWPNMGCHETVDYGRHSQIEKQNHTSEMICLGSLKLISSAARIRIAYFGGHFSMPPAW
ncbi:hypothetical protein VULLAG_LOCUS11170 [Vulpes lagopus]